MIATERLFLRPILPEDVDPLLRVFGDPVVMAAFDSAPFDRDQVRRWVQRNLDHQDQHGYGLFTVILKESGAIIGDCGLEHMELDDGPATGAAAELGYDLRSDHWNRGLATEAATAVRDHAFPGWSATSADGQVLPNRMDRPCGLIAIRLPPRISLASDNRSQRKNDRFRSDIADRRGSTPCVSVRPCTRLVSAQFRKKRGSPARLAEVGRYQAMQGQPLPREWVTLQRPQGLAGVEVYRGVCRSSYPRQLPDSYRFGMVMRGTQEHLYRRQRRIVSEGRLLLMQPGEAVSGAAVDAAGFDWRMITLDTRLLRDAAEGVGLKDPDGPDFPEIVAQGEDLVRAFLRLHASLSVVASAETRDLERDAHLAAFLHDVISRCAKNRPSAQHEIACDSAVHHAREYLHDHYAADVSLSVLARVSGADSTFRLVREFTRVVGLPPHAYQIHIRVQRAKRLLAAGAAIADVSLAVGFGDQSHLTRRFTPIVGITPGAFRRACAHS